MGKILSLNTSKDKGTIKHQVNSFTLIENFGVLDDAHAGASKRQVSLLAYESFKKMVQPDGTVLPFGSFAENITTEGIELFTLPIGTKLSIGNAILEVSQIGKTCHTGCEISKTVGSCVMPKEGIFCTVLKGDVINVGEEIVIL